MNLDRARLALLTTPATPVWSGTVVSWGVEQFNLTVTPVAGTYPDDIANLLIVHRGVHLARIKRREGNVLYLAETPVQFVATFPVAIYDARLPFPRYQYIDDGVVYKDRDIAFPDPWQRAMPPTALLRGRVGTNEWGQAVYAAVGETIHLDAANSYPNLDDGAPLTYAWTPGAGGAITGAGATVTCVYSTAGFRYLKLVVTDAHGTAVERYLPIWVGAGNVISNVTACRARWDVKAGWTIDLELQSSTALLQYTPALLVDVETNEALFFGFIVPNSRNVTFETMTQALTLQSALAFSRYVHAYPFLVTGVTGAAEPSEWAEMYEPTLARALWFLLWWHSTLPEIVNTNLSAAPVREIAGQEFALGSVPQQVEAVLKSAFWQARGQRAGGFVVSTDPLFLDDAAWAALSAADLAASTTRGALSIELATPQFSQARLGGVYRDPLTGTYEPALIQSPAYPGLWGSPTEVNGLAPLSNVELVSWAIRYITVENTSDTHSVEPGLFVDPVVWRVVDALGTRVSTERTELTFDPDGLRWQQRLSGRTRGVDIGSAVSVPLPPPIEYPPPDLPPFDPPIWEPLPLPEPESDWPVHVWVGTRLNGVYYSADFTDPDESAQPTWALDNGGLPDMTSANVSLMRFSPDPLNQRNQMCVVRNTGVSPETRSIYYRTNAETWNLILTEAQVADYTGVAGTYELQDAVYDQRASVMWVHVRRSDVTARSYLLRYDGAWVSVFGFEDPQTHRYGALSVNNGHILVSWYRNNTVAFRYSTNFGASFDERVLSPSSGLFQAYPHVTNTFRAYSNIFAGVAEGHFLGELVDSAWVWTRPNDIKFALAGADTLWENAAGSPLHGRILYDDKLWITRNGWATVESVDPPKLMPAGIAGMQQLFMPRPAAPDVIFFGRTPRTVVPLDGYYHTLYIRDGETGALRSRAGNDPLGGIASIPYDCGGLARIISAGSGGGGLAVDG